VKKLTLYITILLLLTTSTLSFFYQRERTERLRTEGNQTALLNGIVHYKTSDSLNAVKIQTLELTQKELKAHEKNLVSTIEQQGIKIKRIESVTQVKTESKAEFKASKKDSTIIYLPGNDSIIHLNCLEYKDSFISFTGCYENDSLTTQIIIPVDIDIYAHRLPKQFWFFSYGVKSVDLEVISLNPYTTISYARNIKLKK
jgi:hypothetical protein